MTISIIGANRGTKEPNLNAATQHDVVRFIGFSKQTLKLHCNLRRSCYRPKDPITTKSANKYQYHLIFITKYQTTRSITFQDKYHHKMIVKQNRELHAVGSKVVYGTLGRSQKLFFLYILTLAFVFHDIKTLAIINVTLDRFFSQKCVSLIPNYYNGNDIFI